MFFWFLGTAFLAVWFVFRDDRFDYRVLAFGALLPDTVDLIAGQAWVMHSLTAAVVALIVVMTVARRGTERRRRWLAMPIGMLFHLVFDGAFNNTQNFWWPLAGLSFDGSSVPSLDRMPLNIALECAGVVMLAWMWRANNMGAAHNRERFIRTGRLIGGTDKDVGTC